MSLILVSVLKNGMVFIIGGTATPLTSLGNTLNTHNLFMDGTDHLTRTEVVATVKQPKPSVGAPNGYTQARSILTIKTPLALDNGNYTVNTVQISFSCDVETTQAEKQTLLNFAVNALSDSDFTEFWENQSVA
jgi:hypothetical protein